MVGEKTKTLLPKAGEIGEAPPSIDASVAGNGVPTTPEPPPDPLDTLPDPPVVEALPVDALPEAPVPEVAPAPALPEGPIEPLDAPALPPDMPLPVDATPLGAKAPLDAPAPLTALPAELDPDWAGPFLADEAQPATATRRAPPRRSTGATEGRASEGKVNFILA
jgi:hypothetical protein